MFVAKTEVPVLLLLLQEKRKANDLSFEEADFSQCQSEHNRPLSILCPQLKLALLHYKLHGSLPVPMTQEAEMGDTGSYRGSLYTPRVLRLCMWKVGESKLLGECGAAETL